MSPFLPEPKVVTKTEYVKQNVPIQPAPKPVTMNDVTWQVVTNTNIDQVIERMKAEYGDDWVFYAFSVKDYEGMALNFAEIRRYIQQQRAVINFYEDALKEKPNDARTTK